jgi:Na+/H+ antiporter NhaD/arsenite permease-like protein
MSFALVSSLVVFAFVYAAVASGRLDRAKAAFFGGMLLLLAGVLDFETAVVRYIDWETIGLLTGMMVIAGVIGDTGVFQFAALKAVRWTRGRYLLLVVSLSALTAVFSAFLDNVTTILLLGPIGILACDALHRRPLVMLVALTLASNIGGMATLIGDPPHMMIGSATGLSFNDFIVNLGPMSVLALVVTLALVYALNRREFTPSRVPFSAASFDEARYIKDRRKTALSLGVLGLTILGFTILPALGVSVAVVALFGASLLMLVNRDRAREVLGHVEWPLIFFFLGLFVVTGALQETGAVAVAGRWLASLTGDPFLFTVVILWASTLGVAFISAVPYTAVMIPIIGASVAHLGLSAAAAQPIWWALSLSAAIGGNGTVIGAAATMAAVTISERTPEPITFKNYLRYGMPTMIASQLVSTLYLWLRYFVLRG